MMSEHMHVPVAATEKCAQNPAHDADNDRSPERAPEVIHMEADHHAVVLSENQARGDAGGASPEETARQVPGERHGAPSRKEPATDGTRVSIAPEAGGLAEPADDAIRLGAYLISERRRKFALPG